MINYRATLRAIVPAPVWRRLWPLRRIDWYLSAKGSHSRQRLLALKNKYLGERCFIDGKPINFSFDRKTNSQELTPVQRITWSITGWRTSTYIAAYEAGQCATFAGRVGYYPIWSPGRPHHQDPSGPAHCRGAP